MIGIEFVSTMALVAAASVFVNVLIALTLLPAFLGLIGERICSPKQGMKKTATMQIKLTIELQIVGLRGRSNTAGLSLSV
ncbi:MMPL family transporter [Paenibacillus rhizoplanae]